jgi:hypothetical protein
MSADAKVWGNRSTVVLLVIVLGVAVLVLGRDRVRDVTVGDVFRNVGGRVGRCARFRHAQGKLESRHNQIGWSRIQARATKRRTGTRPPHPVRVTGSITCGGVAGGPFGGFPLLRDPP